MEKQDIGIDLNENEQPEPFQKIFDGHHYYILRGGKRYTALGQEIK